MFYFYNYFIVARSYIDVHHNFSNINYTHLVSITRLIKQPICKHIIKYAPQEQKKEKSLINHASTKLNIVSHNGNKNILETYYFCCINGWLHRTAYFIHPKASKDYAVGATCLQIASANFACNFTTPYRLTVWKENYFSSQLLKFKICFVGSFNITVIVSFLLIVACSKLYVPVLHFYI